MRAEPGMWVRSYRTRSDELHGCMAAGQGMLGFFVFSTEGELILCEGPLSYTGTRIARHWPRIVFRGPNDDHLELDFPSQVQSISSHFGFAFNPSWTFPLLILPYWFLVLASGSLAMAQQLRWPLRFTLRSLFIATTFLAIVLRMIAWLDRAWIGK
jgi:hypothetical protein